MKTYFFQGRMNWWICFQYLTASVVYCLAWFSWNVVYREFEPRSGQTKDYKIGIGCFSASLGVLKSKNKDCLTHNQDVSELGNISTHGQLFQCTNTMKSVWTCT